MSTDVGGEKIRTNFNDLSSLTNFGFQLNSKRLGYQVLIDVDQDDDSGVVRGWAMEVNAGAKYWQNDLILDYCLVVGPDSPLIEHQEKTTQSWWDPMLGVKARLFQAIHQSGHPASRQVPDRQVHVTVHRQVITAGSIFSDHDNSDFWTQHEGLSAPELLEPVLHHHQHGLGIRFGRRRPQHHELFSI